MTPDRIAIVLVVVLALMALFRTFRVDTAREAILRGYAYAEQLAVTKLKAEGVKMTSLEKLSHATQVAQSFSPALKKMSPVRLRALMESEIHHSKKK